MLQWVNSFAFSNPILRNWTELKWNWIGIEWELNWNRMEFEWKSNTNWSVGSGHLISKTIHWVSFQSIYFKFPLKFLSNSMPFLFNFHSIPIQFCTFSIQFELNGIGKYRWVNPLSDPTKWYQHIAFFVKLILNSL